MGEERALNQTKGSGMLGRARAEESELPSLLFVWMTVVKQETLKQRSEGQEGVSGREDGGCSFGRRIGRQENSNGRISTL